MWGISYPGFYTAAGMIDAHPAFKAASPQAPVTDWFTGDDWHHNGAFQLPHAFNFLASFGHPRPEPTKKTAGAIRSRHTRRLRVLPPAGAALQRQRPLFQERRAVLERDHAARDVRRVLAGAEPAPAPEEHQAGRHDGRRLVRRRKPLRCARDLQERRGQQPRRDQRPGDGPLAPRRLEPVRRSQARPDLVLLQDRRVLSREDRVSLLPVLPERKGLAELSRRPGSSRRGPTSGGRSTSGPREPRGDDRSICEPSGGLAFEPPGRHERARPFDEYTSDPAHPVEYIDQIEIRHDGRLHDPGPAVRVAPARRAGLPERAAAKRRDDRRTDRGPSCSSRPPEPTPTGSSS